MLGPESTDAEGDSSSIDASSTLKLIRRPPRIQPSGAGLETFVHARAAFEAREEQELLLSERQWRRWFQGLRRHTCDERLWWGVCRGVMGEHPSLGRILTLRRWRRVACALFVGALIALLVSTGTTPGSSNLLLARGGHPDRPVIPVRVIDVSSKGNALDSAESGFVDLVRERLVLCAPQVLGVPQWARERR